MSAEFSIQLRKKKCLSRGVGCASLLIRASCGGSRRWSGEQYQQAQRVIDFAGEDDQLSTWSLCVNSAQIKLCIEWPPLPHGTRPGPTRSRTKAGRLGDTFQEPVFNP